MVVCTIIPQRTAFSAFFVFQHFVYITNKEVFSGGIMKKIKVSDFTISAFEDSCKFRKKTESAKELDSAGVDIIELGQVKNNKRDAVVFKTVASVVKNSAVAVSADSRETVEFAWSCIKEAKKPRIVVSLPVSTVQMEYFYHMKAPKMLSYIESICSAARGLCPEVEFEARDATRADAEFLKEAFAVAERSGACAVTICDDAGVSMPEDFAALVKAAKESCGCEVFVKPSDEISMAAVCAFYAASAGADGVKCSAVGDDSLSADVLSDIIRKKGEALGASLSLDATVIHRTVSAVREEEGVLSEKTIAENDKVVLDRNSSLDSVTEAAANLGYELSVEDCKKVYEEFTRVAKEKETVGTRELDAIVAAAAMQVPSAYHVVSYTINCGNVICAMAHIVLERDGEKISGTGTGDGPIDAAFSAIGQTIGHQYELDDFQIQAVTKGYGAVGSTIVKLRKDGRLYPGVGVSTDIVGASIRAYINALNKIVYDEK